MTDSAFHKTLVVLFFTTSSWNSVAAQSIESNARTVPAYPPVSSKKGLQVQMVDDALLLGIHHAAINLNLGQLIVPEPSISSLAFEFESETYHFSENYLNALDGQIQALSDANVIVTLIILNIEPRDESRRRILLHPQYSAECPNKISAFNTVTDEGVRWLHAAMHFLAQRYSSSAETQDQGSIRNSKGLVWNWIL